MPKLQKERRKTFVEKIVLDISTSVELVNGKECQWRCLQSGLLFHQSIRYFCSTVCHYSFNLMLPLVCHVKYHLNAGATETGTHTLLTAVLKRRIWCVLHLVRLEWKSTVEKYNFSFGTAGKGLQYLSPLLSKRTLQRPTHTGSLEKSEPKIDLSISSKLGCFFFCNYEKWHRTWKKREP